jgi:H+/gluconate symporter-like permease
MGLYIAAFSGLGASSLPLEWVWPVAWISLAVGVVLVARTARRRRHVAPLLFTASGALVLVAGRIADAPVALLAVGSALVVVGSMWSVIHRGAFRARRPIAV